MGSMDGGLHVAPPGSAAGVALAGAGVGLAAGLLAAVFTFERRIAPTNKLGWSWSTFARNLPTVLAAVVGAIVVTLVVDRFLSGLAVHLVYGLLLVVLFKAVTREPDMNGRGRRPWSRAELRRRLPERWQRVAVVALVVAAVLAAGAAAAVFSGAPPRTLAYRLGARLVVGLTLGLMFGPQTPLSDLGPAPGQGIETSRRNGLTAGLVAGLVALLLFGLVDGISTATMFGPVIGVITGAADGLCISAIVAVGVSLRRGGGAYLRHAVLRRLLVREGSAPPDYVGFLDHASRLILLRRRGGGYEFVHRLLLEHFALLEPDYGQP